MKFVHRTLVALLFSSMAGTAAVAQSLILVPSQATVQQAINQVSDGGIIEIANGTYAAPAGGFQASNLGKSFTMRAAVAATVTLTGSNTTDILRIANGSAALGKPITFERMTFANGRTTNGGLGGALSLVEATVTFVNCTFQNNTAAVPAGGGGGAITSNAANLTFVGTTFSSNSATTIGNGGAIRSNNSRILILDSAFTSNNATQSGGAINAGGSSRIFIHNTRFENNRVNLPGHFVDSLGGAISLVDSQLRVTNSRFAGNRAGYSGGAVYAFGWWSASMPTDVVTANTTFVDNASERDPSVAGTNVPVGGAVQVEDQATLNAYNTRFITNRAQIGGAISSYRAIVNVTDSAFHGNSVTGTIPGASMGGAIAASSEDSDALDGQVNRRNTSVTLRNTLFQGRFGSVGNAARSGGCLYIVGDLVRAYGLGGNAQMGTIAANRAPLTIEGSAFYDCDVAENSGGGMGGAGILQLTTTQISDSLFAGCDATPNAANTGSGGALFVFDNSDMTIQRTAFIRSTAGFAGGAIYSQGSRLDVSDSQFAENQLVGGSRWGGTAIWTGWENIGAPRPAVNATGIVRNSVMSNNSGAAAVLDYDANAAPFNLMQYAANSIFPNSTAFYSNAFTTAQTVAQVNSLTLHGQAKAPTPNTGLASAPAVVALRTVPSKTLPTYAIGDPAQPTASFAAYAWSGGSASLDGVPVSGNLGLTSVAAGVHQLTVGATSASATTIAGPAPATDLRARPQKIGPGAGTTLQWTQLAGAFVEQFIDLGVNLTPPGIPSGSVAVAPNNRSLTYRSLLVTQEGGATDTAPVTYIADLIFADVFE
ncbi:MAG TPA: hypothetical protein VLF18_14435 [Tahibacter sp.]|uniref:hypothetical protein n=1 Tax=Tahibacter sp. TaxID=2056211 RepID=UPI002B5AE99A|nr:hypothetical protein [Tahibacter sp.]HSX61396.1 hypothetical protein [Tahibacter sp.]